MKNQLKVVIAAVVIIVVILIGALVIYPMFLSPSPTPTATTRTIIDMYGRNVTVPTNITRVLVTGPIEMELVYMLAPDKLAGLTFTFNGNPIYAQTKYANLTVVGGWYGQSTGKIETFLADNPDVIIDSVDVTNDTLATRQTAFGTVPVVGVTAGSLGDCLTQYAPEITFLGELLGVQDQANLLLNYYQDAMNYVDSINHMTYNWQNKTTVYYAEGKDGLSTDPAGSQHTTLILFCGGIDVATVPLGTGYGMVTAGMENVLKWNASMIIIGRGSQASLYNQIMANSTWQQLTAVQQGKVYLRPDNPCSWFDGPPGPGQILGLYWMVNKLYPSLTTDLNMTQQTITFYSEFYHYNLTSTEVQTLLSGGNV